MPTARRWACYPKPHDQKQFWFAGNLFLNPSGLTSRRGVVPNLNRRTTMSIVLAICIATGSSLSIPVIAAKRRVFG